MIKIYLFFVFILINYSSLLKNSKSHKFSYYVSILFLKVIKVLEKKYYKNYDIISFNLTFRLLYSFFLLIEDIFFLYTILKKKIRFYKLKYINLIVI